MPACHWQAELSDRHGALSGQVTVRVIQCPVPGRPSLIPGREAGPGHGTFALNFQPHWQATGKVVREANSIAMPFCLFSLAVPVSPGRPITVTVVTLKQRSDGPGPVSTGQDPESSRPARVGIEQRRNRPSRRPAPTEHRTSTGPRATRRTPGPDHQ